MKNIVFYEPNDPQVARDLCSDGKGIATLLGITKSLEDAQILCREDAEQYALDCGYETSTQWESAEGSKFPVKSDFVHGFEWAGRRYRIEAKDF